MTISTDLALLSLRLFLWAQSATCSSSITQFTLLRMLQAGITIYVSSAYLIILLPGVTVDKSDALMTKETGPTADPCMMLADKGQVTHVRSNWLADEFWERAAHRVGVGRTLFLSDVTAHKDFRDYDTSDTQQFLNPPLVISIMVTLGNRISAFYGQKHGQTSRDGIFRSIHGIAR